MDQELIVTDPDRVQAQALIQLGGSGMVPICIRHAGPAYPGYCLVGRHRPVSS